MDEMAAAMPIAIVGMSCRFPGGAESPEDFWDLLYNGSSSWSKVPEARFNAKAFYDPDPKIRGTVRARFVLDSHRRTLDIFFSSIVKVPTFSTAMSENSMPNSLVSI